MKSMFEANWMILERLDRAPQLTENASRCSPSVTSTGSAGLLSDCFFDVCCAEGRSILRCGDDLDGCEHAVFEVAAYVAWLSKGPTGAVRVNERHLWISLEAYTVSRA